MISFSSRRRHTRLQGDWSSDVCSSDLSITASSCSLRGNCQARSPNTSSQPSPSSALMVSGGSSRGAKMRIFGLDMQAPWHRGLIQLDVGLLNNGGERLALLAREVCEGLPGKAGEFDCKGIEPFAYV